MSYPQYDLIVLAPNLLPGPVVNDGLVLVEIRVGEAELLEEPLHVLLERLADDGLDDGRQQREPVGRVVVLLA